MLAKIKQKLYGLSNDILYRFDLAINSKNLPLLSKADLNIVDQLKKEGVVMTSLEDLAIPLTPQLKKAASYLVEDLENNGVTTPPSQNKKEAFSHSLPIDPIKISQEHPEIFLWGLEERILDILDYYIGVPSVCHGVNIRRDIVDGKQIGTRYWHMDGEDRNVVKIIIYLSDVDHHCGPFEYIPKSLTPSYKTFKNINYTITNEDMERVIPASQWRQCIGRVGTVILVDTGQVFHHGKIPEAARTAIFYGYTSHRPKRPELCQSSSFRKGLPYFTHPLSERQRKAIWHSQDLPSNTFYSEES
ncbi:hypothetical protein [Leptolyngbya sp. PCC 6406]|uniref:hypothetical protein n=1 Tax=Leptolyngbya sp. PCC 6406 TaxID=1173264 RepID=UPI0002AD059A|nr:hypothetical protein [Leptolyngbya sp. PCC 6406]